MIKRICAALCAVLLLCGIALADERGSLRLDWFSGGAMGIRFIDIVMEDEADTLSFWPNDTVSDAVLEELTMDEDGFSAHVVWTKESLESNEVVCLQAYTGEVMPRFRVSLTNGQGERERWLIDVSGEDGSLLLLENETLRFLGEDRMRSRIEQTETLYGEICRALDAEQDAANREGLISAALGIWEQARTACWEGFVQSPAEQHWASMRNGEEDELTAAAMTREHVLLLTGIDLP